MGEWGGEKCRDEKRVRRRRKIRIGGKEEYNIRPSLFYEAIDKGNKIRI